MLYQSLNVSSLKSLNVQFKMYLCYQAFRNPLVMKLTCLSSEIFPVLWAKILGIFKGQSVTLPKSLLHPMLCYMKL